jgi:hypothetical protein
MPIKTFTLAGHDGIRLYNWAVHRGLITGEPYDEFQMLEKMANEWTAENKVVVTTVQIIPDMGPPRMLITYEAMETKAYKPTDVA